MTTTKELTVTQTEVASVINDRGLTVYVHDSNVKSGFNVVGWVEVYTAHSKHGNGVENKTQCHSLPPHTALSVCCDSSPTTTFQYIGP